MSSFLQIPHLVHIGTYTFRKIGRKLYETCGIIASFSSFWETWLNQEVSTFVPISHNFDCFGVVAVLSYFPELIPGFAPSFARKSD